MNLAQQLKQEYDVRARFPYTLKGRDGKPFAIIYFSPLTLAQREDVDQKAKHLDGDSVGWSILLLISKARDIDGSPVFEMGDFDTLKSEVPSKVIQEMVAFMINCETSVEDQKKS
jgi:hypothetical protein